MAAYEGTPGLIELQLLISAETAAKFAGALAARNAGEVSGPIVLEATLHEVTADELERQAAENYYELQTVDGEEEVPVVTRDSLLVFMANAGWYSNNHHLSRTRRIAARSHTATRMLSEIAPIVNASRDTDRDLSGYVVAGQDDQIAGIKVETLPAFVNAAREYHGFGSGYANLLQALVIKLTAVGILPTDQAVSAT